MRKKLADLSYTVLECYLQGNWAQDARWINIMLTFRGNLQQVCPKKTSILVGQDGSDSSMSSGLV